MARETIQIKASGMMCSFCTMSVEKALKKLPGVESVLCNLVHGVILVEADTSMTSRKTLADAVNALGYPVSETQQQQLQKDQAFYEMVRWRGLLGLGLAAVDVLVDPIDIFALPGRVRSLFSLAVALFVLIWVGKPVLIRTVAAVRRASSMRTCCCRPPPGARWSWEPCPSSIRAGRTSCPWRRGSWLCTSSPTTSSSAPT